MFFLFLFILFFCLDGQSTSETNRCKNKIKSVGYVLYTTSIRRRVSAVPPAYGLGNLLRTAGPAAQGLRTCAQMRPSCAPQPVGWENVIKKRLSEQIVIINIAMEKSVFLFLLCTSQARRHPQRGQETIIAGPCHNLIP